MYFLSITSCLSIIVIGNSNCLKRLSKAKRKAPPYCLFTSALYKSYCRRIKSNCYHCLILNWHRTQTNSITLAHWLYITPLWSLSLWCDFCVALRNFGYLNLYCIYISSIFTFRIYVCQIKSAYSSLLFVFFFFFLLILLFLLLVFILCFYYFSRLLKLIVSLSFAFVLPFFFFTILFLSCLAACRLKYEMSALREKISL